MARQEVGDWIKVKQITSLPTQLARFGPVNKLKILVMLIWKCEEIFRSILKRTGLDWETAINMKLTQVANNE